jgi:WD40 repeat protein
MWESSNWAIELLAVFSSLQQDLLQQHVACIAGISSSRTFPSVPTLFTPCACFKWLSCHLLLLQPHRAPVADMAIDASGGYLASGSADRAIKVTDLAGGYVTHHFTGHG